jgi:outer membrane protein TolC
LIAWAALSRPGLAAARARRAQAGTRVSLARREIWPDLMLGVQYGQRPAADGTERMASLMLGFTVPVFAHARQRAMTREAEAMQRMADAALAEAQVEVTAAIAEQLAELDRARELVTLYRREILPQAEATIESANTAYRSGTVDFMTLVDATLAANRYSLELARLLADYGTAFAALEATVGRTLPVTGPLLAEAA